ncbi:von Willebrand factor type A domain-containing protein [Reichenbachiella agarivorans]|uniref:von Willebrand factor type A domain-containing protein n=1 Tax=Reichenbachiella agarivorans TaxID=2979464 RepID=A0ABY6CS83_9BACT|nr:von Willebrand factor type A domain-containing protein [Reichenbachiella agarivorans]UXP33386.1 von Willebrand factor type A domain-containing protein [Reichenbachiella agarivorans]
MRQITILMMTLMIATAAMSPSLDQEITGQVTSADDGQPIAGVNVLIKGSVTGTITDLKGNYKITVPTTGKQFLVFSFIGYESQEVEVKNQSIINISMISDQAELEEVVVIDYGRSRKKEIAFSMKSSQAAPMHHYEQDAAYLHNTEDYDAINENIFLAVKNKPLSTFSIDVDAASYSNMRRFINNGQKPPKDAVRIEEMINYFNYDYSEPTGNDPFSINTEIAPAPWNEKHKLVHIGLQGKHIPTDDLPASNLVFLLDVSGSMSDANKLPLLKSGFKLLVQQLRPQDRVAIVVYAGAAGLVLPSTPGDEKETIIRALDNLQAGGSTAGGAGINLAYKVAQDYFKPNGNNRIILATDGDFNVGESSDAGMERLIEQKREEGVFLTVLGFGMGNYKDAKMETIADKGNGNYAYIDNILEAKKVLVNEFGGTLFTIAKDVKIQVEFNPTKVQAYRLIGYENRALRDEDFNNDKKDAGELGAGHTVTALYEIIPVGVKSEFSPVDELKYQKMEIDESAYQSDELMMVKLRYKDPKSSKSQLIEHPLLDQPVDLDQISDNFRWSASVAAFGMILRDSAFKGDISTKDILAMAQASKGKDENGYRVEFINLVKSYQLMVM